MNPNRMISIATLCLASTLLAQTTEPTTPGAEPGSQGVFVNATAAARNAHRPGIWIGASVQAHQDFYANAFNGPNISEMEVDPDLDSALKAEVITTLFDSANLALFAASQQFLADLEAANQDDEASDPIGEGPLDDFFGDIDGDGGNDDNTDAGVDEGTSVDDGDSLSNDEIDDFFGPLGARAISVFDDEMEIDVFEETEVFDSFEPDEELQ